MTSNASSNLSRRPTILFINNTSRLDSGTSHSLLLIVEALKEHFSVSVVSDHESIDLPGELKKIGVKHYAFHDRTILFFPELIFQILSRKINLVYGNNLSGRSQVAFWAAKITRRPFIWHIRESVRKNDPRVNQIRNADAVIANSEDTCRRLTEFAGVNSPIVIPNGVEINNFMLDRDLCRKQLIHQLGCPSDSVFVINLGRLCEQKNQPDAVRVGIKVLERYPQTQFLFLGALQDSEYISQMNKEINHTEYKDRFHILGHINDFIPYLIGSDILLHTARWEPQGRVILEAMAAKLPVVAYCVGGVGEAVVQGKTGFLREFGDSEGMAEDLRKLIHDKELRLRFGVAGCERVDELFTAERTAEQVRNVIDQVLKNER